MNILIIVGFRTEANMLNSCLKPGSKAVVPGDSTMGMRFDEILMLAELHNANMTDWYQTAALTRLKPGGRIVGA